MFGGLRNITPPVISGFCDGCENLDCDRNGLICQVIGNCPRPDYPSFCESKKGKDTDEKKED